MIMVSTVSIISSTEGTVAASAASVSASAKVQVKYKKGKVDTWRLWLSTTIQLDSETYQYL